MNVEQFADWLAHLGASEFAKSSIPVPDRAVTRSATIEAAGVKVVVTVVSAEPFHLELTPDGQARLGAIAAPVPARPAQPILTDAQQAIVDLLDDKPRKATVLAAKLRKPCCGSFRGILANLVRFGIIAKVKGGYVLAGKMSGTSSHE